MMTFLIIDRILSHYVCFLPFFTIGNLTDSIYGPFLDKKPISEQEIPL